MNLIDCYTVRGQFKEALAMIETFKERYPGSPACLDLEQKSQWLKRKYEFDKFYHSAWMRDICQKNSTNYRLLVNTLAGIDKDQAVQDLR